MFSNKYYNCLIYITCCQYTMEINQSRQTNLCLFHFDSNLKVKDTFILHHILTITTNAFIKILNNYDLYIQFHEVTLKTFDDGKKIRIYDCRGVHCYNWEGENYRDDLIKAVDGCIRKNYPVQCICLFFVFFLCTYLAHYYFNFSVSLIQFIH